MGTDLESVWKKMGDAEMSQAIVKDYLVENGGITRNVDLVRHFRKFLQSEDLASKGEYKKSVLQRAVFVLLSTAVPR